MNAGVIVMRKQLPPLHSLLDYWLTLTRVNQMAADQGCSIWAGMHEI